ncbi:MAG: alpha/beta hydrolase [Thermoleophilia bacterium]|nr:alpha/beta hydrolase [Thermoleophilia bacterium]
MHQPRAAGPHPALCICHGIPAVPFNPADTGYHDLAARFAELGLVTLIFNLRGAGLSEGDFDMLGWSRDIGSAIDLLSEEETVDPSKVFLMGFSGGAAAGIHRAASDTRVAGVISCASPAHFRDLTGDGELDQCLARWREIGIIRDPAFPANLESWAAGFLEVAPAAHVGCLAPRPLLILHGDADEVVPLSHAHDLFNAAHDPKQLSIIPGGMHRLRVNEQAMSTAVDWLRALTTG